MRLVRRTARLVDVGRVIRRPGWRALSRTIEVVFFVAIAYSLLSDGWHRLAHTYDRLAGKRVHGILWSPIAILVLVLVLVVVLLAERSYRQRTKRQATADVAERRSAEPKKERAHVSAVAGTWVVAGVVLGCAATMLPGPVGLRAVVAVAVMAVAMGRGVSLTKAPVPRPAWLLALSDLGLPYVSGLVGIAMVVAILGAALRLPVGGLGAGGALIAGVAARRDIGNRWASEELRWWQVAAAEVGAERIAVVRAVRPDPVAWPAGVDSTTRTMARKLAREHDDSSPEHLAHLWEERHGAGGTVPAEAFAAAVAERDAPWGATVTLTADRVAGDADAAALRLGERLGREWLVTSDGSARRIVVGAAGPPEALPAMVELEELLPDQALEVDVDDLALPVAVNSTGDLVAFDPSATPHALVAGETGSGKTILLTDLAVSALARGWEVAICEVTKGGLDFLPLKDWTSGWAGQLDEALVLVRAVYAEVRRRRDVLHAHGEVKWQDLPKHVREAEQIRPLSLLFDEVASALIAGVPPRGLDKGHPLVCEAEERLAATSELRLLLGKLAREARFVGISLVLGIQRPDVAILGGVDGAGGELRANLGWRVQLAPPRNLPARETVGMLFGGEATAQALAELARLNDGVSRGLGVVWSDGGGIQGVRVAYHPPADVPALLDRLGVPRRAGPRLGEASHLPAAPRGGEDPHLQQDAHGEENPHLQPDPPPDSIRVDRRPDGTPLRVIAQAPGVDAATWGVQPRFRLELGPMVAEAAGAADLVGLLIDGYDDQSDPVDRAASRIRFARSVRLDAQSRVAGPLLPHASPSEEERAVLAGVAKPTGEWTSMFPVVAVDATFPAGDEVRGNVVWIRARTDESLLASLASIGLVDAFSVVTPSRH